MTDNRKHLATIVVVSLAFKFLFIFFSLFVLHQGFDVIDQIYYYDAGKNLLSGLVPYANFGFDYPPLAILPMALSFWITATFEQFYNTFSLIMIFCDLVTCLCVYFIALKVFENDESTAFRAALVYATALETCYFTLTVFDAFPTMFMMLAILFTVCGVNSQGYLAILAGIFTKVFPLILWPFLFIYNLRESSLMAELGILLKYLAALGTLGILFLYVKSVGGFTWENPNVYVDTPYFTLYGFLHDILGLSWVSLSSLASSGFVALIFIEALLVVLFFSSSDKRPRAFLKVLLLALFSFVFLWSYHSPQYIFWYFPLIAILVADDLHSIILFYLVQVLAFIEFPQMHLFLYSMTHYAFTLAENPTSWYLTWGFFVVFQSLLLYLVYRAVKLDRYISLYAE